MKVGYHASGATSGIDETDVAVFTLENCDVTLIVTENLGLNYDQFFGD